MAASRQTQVNGICDKMRAGKIDGRIVMTIQKKQSTAELLHRPSLAASG